MITAAKRSPTFPNAIEFIATPLIRQMSADRRVDDFEVLSFCWTYDNVTNNETDGSDLAPRKTRMFVKARRVSGEPV